MTDLISRADALEQMAQAECGLHYDDCEADNCSCSYIKRILDIPSAELPKGDLILRADALNLNCVITVRRADTKERKCDDEIIKVCFEAYADHIKRLPSARPTGEWIPCSERMPSESGDYLATIPLDADETYTEVLMYHNGRFYEDDDEWGATYHDDVIAWMPLPKPYREDGEV